MLKRNTSLSGFFKWITMLYGKVNEDEGPIPSVLFIQNLKEAQHVNHTSLSV